MGLFRWISDRLQSFNPQKVRLVKRYAFSQSAPKQKETLSPVVRIKPECRKDPGTSDEVDLLLEGLVIRVQRDIRLNVPFEVTVVVPRAEVTKRYQDGKLIETKIVYSSVTVAHSPRL
ncbi:MAG: hypothetical protein IMF26_01570 [Candidatus Fermentithermobacillus carboniphilus]|uniref:Uncharacterized protein n=1 Tax=Candidatus Fermentithermobacillus carboniphilus TaxID=3085328 RepID=A0AAT9LEZ9_9FIRM|nr:MAG: hypothetical protein IMF26_01570 [Candidatus Fermentithermobacillus carboniphilus]